MVNDNSKKSLVLVLLVFVLVVQYGMTIPGTLDGVGAQRLISYFIGLPILSISAFFIYRVGRKYKAISIVVFFAQILMAAYTLYKLDFYIELHWGQPIKPESMKDLYRPRTTILAVVSSLTMLILFSWSLIKGDYGKEWRFFSSRNKESVYLFSFLGLIAFVFSYVQSGRFGELKRAAMPSDHYVTEYLVVQENSKLKAHHENSSTSSDSRSEENSYSEWDYEQDEKERLNQIREEQYRQETERELKNERDGTRTDWYNSIASELSELAKLEKRYEVRDEESSLESSFSEFLFPIWNTNLTEGQMDVGFREPLTGEIEQIRNGIRDSTLKGVFPSLYLYLLNTHAPLPHIDSLRITEYGNMIDDFYQRFENNIVFKYDYLPEQGDSYYCLFPTDDIDSVRDIMKYLLKDFNSNLADRSYEHRWITPNYFGIDGVGCQYHIVRTEFGILVTNYCGC